MQPFGLRGDYILLVSMKGIMGEGTIFKSAKSHGFVTRFTVLNQISRSHDKAKNSHGLLTS